MKFKNKYLIVPSAGINQFRFYGSRFRDLSLKALRQNLNYSIPNTVANTSGIEDSHKSQQSSKLVQWLVNLMDYLCQIYEPDDPRQNL